MFVHSKVCSFIANLGFVVVSRVVVHSESRVCRCIWGVLMAACSTERWVRRHFYSVCSFIISSPSVFKEWFCSVVVFGNLHVCRCPLLVVYLILISSKCDLSYLLSFVSFVSSTLSQGCLSRSLLIVWRAHGGGV